MLAGVLVSEGLREGAALDDLDLTISKIERIRIDEPAEDQPPLWNPPGLIGPAGHAVGVELIS